jgi:hypothetical protein
MTTLLTGDYTPPTPQELARRAEAEKKAEQALNAYRLILEQTLLAYQDGEITFESAIRTATRAVRGEDIPADFQWQKMLGAFTERICTTNPQKRGRASSRANPKWLRRAIAELVPSVRKRENLPITRSAKGKNAFDRVTEILKKRGIQTTPSSVERVYLECDVDNDTH